MRQSSIGSSSRHSNYSRSFHLPDEENAYDDYPAPSSIGGAMLPAFLKDLGRATTTATTTTTTINDEELVEVELQVEDDNIYICSVTPRATTPRSTGGGGGGGGGGILSRSLSAASKLRKKFAWPSSSRPSSEAGDQPLPPMTERDKRKMRAQLQRTTSGAQRALTGLRFISMTTCTTTGDDGGEEMWKQVEARFDELAQNGLLAREDFGACIGMANSKEFAIGIFDALARRKRQRLSKICKEELQDFWLQLTNQSFDARLQIFFDIADSNEDGRITRDEVQELIMLSASANRLSSLKEQAHEYANLIMEELDPENLGYIELWQLEALLLQRDVYMEYSRPLSTVSAGWSQNLSTLRPVSLVRKVSCTLRCLILENWQRGWIILLWVTVMASLFVWKFLQYRKKSAFQVMGYCLCTAKGAAETLKLNMALILLPVSRNTLTWLRSTRARCFIPFDDNINFHKIIACAIAIGVLLHAGIHLTCDFPRLINSSPGKFALIASDFNNKKPTYWDLVKGIEGVTGIGMVVLMMIAFTLATSRFRRDVVKLPAPFNRLAGYNAFWYSHHLLAIVYVMLVVHGFFLFLVKDWTKKTTWMYISIPLLLYIAERSLRTCRSEIRSVKILKVSELPGNVFSLLMSKPQGFKYKSGQYIFLQCPAISKFEWHPFSITSAPGDNFLSVHIRIVGDWTQELKQVFTEGRMSVSSIGRLKFEEEGIRQRGLPRLHVDGPYGAPAQEYQSYDVLLLVGLGIGATPFISILKDLLNNARAATDSTTDFSISDDSLSSFASASTAQSGNKRPMRVKSAQFYWVTREPGSFEWFKGVMNEVAEMDHKGLIEMHNYLTSVYEEGDARSTLLTLVQALTHAKYGVDILSGTRVKTHFARPDWKEVFAKIAKKHPYSTIVKYAGVFYCGRPVLAKELKKLAHEMSHKTSTRFEFHKEQF
ncbi:respiratory burst oxidase homolog protein E isoform X1 [Beta vulgaris subsp. vulgaris]|uniref:respiratory burst oxidase homolog protein E isoform X1 n=1 Tax=Beta vulgaris subsp. vulgaris TaxID=3555 RepID=UPI002036C257|nr:respiratory burst oxidase homolog protein E isoform X1 [Beta vulgaris subsp. vulgaris]